MKKVQLFVAFSIFSAIAISTTSCSSSEEVANTEQELVLPESAKTPEVNAFKDALIKSVKAKSQLSNRNVNSDESKKIEADMTDASKTFLQANGVSNEELQQKSFQDPSSIRRMAIALLAKQTALTSKN
jgi:ribosome-binding protein aMBF1 (putative translation factor)